MRFDKLIYLFFLILLFLHPLLLAGQPLHQRFHSSYEKYKEPTIQDRRFKHEDIVPLIKNLQGKGPFSVRKVGESLEGRDIFLVKAGTGATKILMWSQMHGDEATATMAMMDLFNFFTKSGDGFDDFRKKILTNTTLYFIPMLNPDGAERWERRNAIGIDLNRDALRLQSPEAKILKQIRDETNADWGFNLHDQSRYYAAGSGTDKTATISFLAPAYDYPKSVNTVRSNAMKAIVCMNEVLQQYIPGRVAKYYDSFEPRAFGDNIQKWGTSTILIESGGYPDDPEKQFVRKINYIALLTAFDAIASKSYATKDIAAYNKIPFNSSTLADLILRKVVVHKFDRSFTLDIAFQQDEKDVNQARDYYFVGRISDIGDLSTTNAYKDFDASGYTVVPGKLHPVVFETVTDAHRTPIKEFLEQGYTTIQLMKLPPMETYKNIPLQVVSVGAQPDFEIGMGKNPSFFLQKGGVNRYVVINGVLYDLQKL